jgi:hypothetical protein
LIQAGRRAKSNERLQLIGSRQLTRRFARQNFETFSPFNLNSMSRHTREMPANGPATRHQD